MGFAVGGIWVMLVFLALKFKDTIQAPSDAKKDLQRLGYTQVALDGIKIKSYFGSRKTTLSFSEGVCGFELELAKVPRRDKMGREWSPFILKRGGGRLPVSTMLFAELVQKSIEDTNSVRAELQEVAD